MNKAMQCDLIKEYTNIKTLYKVKKTVAQSLSLSKTSLTKKSLIKKTNSNQRFFICEKTDVSHHQ